jgi:methyl-accepting chemotaxis protein
MKITFYRISGVLLILAAIVGLIFSLFSFYAVWTYKEPVIEGISTGIELLSSTLETTAEGLLVSQKTLNTSVESIRLLQSSLKATADAIGSSGPMLDSIATMMTEDLPTTIRATQSSLEAVEKSTKIIDTVLRALTFFPGISYNPEQPLNEAVGDVSNSLNDLPESLAEMESILTDTKGDLEVIQSDLALLAENMSEIETSMEEYSAVFDQYLELIDQLIDQLETLESNFPKYISWLAVGATIFLVWMAIAQLGLLTQGWELLHRREEEKEAAVDEVEESADKQESQ